VFGGFTLRALHALTCVRFVNNTRHSATWRRGVQGDERRPTGIDAGGRTNVAAYAPEGVADEWRQKTGRNVGAVVLRRH